LADPPFPHDDMKAKRVLAHYTSISAMLAERTSNTPTIVFCGHPSLRYVASLSLSLSLSLSVCVCVCVWITRLLFDWLVVGLAMPLISSACGATRHKTL
jgi:hypothetical protein